MVTVKNLLNSNTFNKNFEEKDSSNNSHNYYVDENGMSISKKEAALKLTNAFKHLIESNSAKLKELQAQKEEYMEAYEAAFKERKTNEYKKWTAKREYGIGTSEYALAKKDYYTSVFEATSYNIKIDSTLSSMQKLAFDNLKLSGNPYIS